MRVVTVGVEMDLLVHLVVPFFEIKIAFSNLIGAANHMIRSHDGDFNVRMVEMTSPLNFHTEFM